MTDKIVYFLRHGEAESNANHFYAGQTDVALTALGLEQAKATAPLLAPIRFDKVFCSDLQRAKNTAALALPGYTCEYTAEIREIHVGKVAKLYLKDCEKMYGEHYWHARKNTDYSYFGGESREDLDARVHAFMDRLTALEDTPTVGVVCHGGVMQSVARYVLGDASHLAMSDNCGICKLKLTDGKWTMCKWNVTVEI